MADKDKIADEKLTDEELDSVSGGWFWQGYNEDQLKTAGVTWIHNNFSADEFIYKGKNITRKEANAVIAYAFFHDMQPASMEDALKFYNNGNISKTEGQMIKESSRGRIARETKKGWSR